VTAAWRDLIRLVRTLIGLRDVHRCLGSQCCLDLGDWRPACVLLAAPERRGGPAAVADAGAGLRGRRGCRPTGASLPALRRTRDVMQPP
jgi:hypothetical protein